MRLVIALSLLLSPSLAFAMPMAVGLIGTLLGTAATTIAIAQIVVMVATMAYSAKQKRKDARQARNEFNSGLQDRLATTIATDVPYRYVIGQARVGANVVAMFKSGDKDQYQHVIAVLAHHECQAIDEIYIHGKAINLANVDANGDVTDGPYHEQGAQTHETVTHTGPVFELDGVPAYPSDPFSGFIVHQGVNPSYDPLGADTSPYLNLAYTLSGPQNKTVTITNGYTGIVYVQYIALLDKPRVRVRVHLGTPGEAADADLIAALPAYWTSAHTLPNQTYLYLRFDINQHELQDGPPTIQADVKGMKLYDPRTGVTAYSTNPVLAAYWYLTSELCGVNPALLPLSQWNTAANVCDEASAILGGAARYTFNGTITADQQQSGVLKMMVAAMVGGIDDTTWDIFAGKYVAPVMDFNQDDIVGGISIIGNTSNADIFNGVRGQYSSSENGYVITDFKPYQNAAFREVDGLDLYTDLDFPYTNTTQRVHNLARIMTERNRNGRMVTFEYSAKAWDLSIGDRFTHTGEFGGFDDHVFIVENTKRKQGAPVVITAQEDAPAIWDESDAVTVDAISNTNLPDPFAIAPLTGIAASSGTDVLLLMSDGTVVSRIFVEWDQATTQAVLNNGQIEVEFARIDNGPLIWQRTTVSGAETSVHLSPVSDNSYYWLRARTANPTLNIKSPWVFLLHQVIGKTEAPAQVDRFKLIEQPGGVRQFFWDMDSPPADLFAFEARYSLGTIVMTWDQMIPLFAKDRNARQHETTDPLNDGVYTFALRAVDSTGNMSDPVYITEVLDGDAFGAVHKIVLPHEEVWPGTKTDCFVSGSLLADAGVLTWNDVDITWGDSTEQWGNTSASPIIYEHTLIDLGAVIDVTMRANSLASGSTLIEVSTSDDDITYSPWSEVPTLAITSRYVKVRWTVTGSAPLLYRAQAIFYT